MKDNRSAEQQAGKQVGQRDERSESRKGLLIVGSGGHGRVLADMGESLGYERIAFLDNRADVTQVKDYPILGTDADVKTMAADFDVVIGIGHTQTRKAIYETMEKEGVSFATLIHPRAVIGSRVTIGSGTVIMAGVVVNCDSEIGKGCILNTHCSVDHDARLGDFVHIAPGATLSGTVTVGEETWVGVGATIKNNVTIASDCLIGAGAAVVQDIATAGTYMGVPAKRQPGKEPTP